MLPLIVTLNLTPASIFRYLKLSKKSSELRILEHDKDVTAICCSSKYVVSGSSDACVKGQGLNVDCYTNIKI